ncbi:YheC/YheD family protein [Paenibacillus sp. Marseille-Q4541]|uniref:YheC/YheD family protein n=1 Tax=Paenibacillus sp. Marseille-Q4541 TaxID=2831522 RepID=UPI001BA88FC8|nr:YheC/YheD family protein [Paenibacillus sp. Marseille-Q4541]
MNYQSTTIKSKWTKTKWLLDSTKTQKYIPKTLPFNRSNLKTMLSDYSTIYFKPTGGSGGFHIIRIKKLGDSYQTQHKTEKKRYSTIDSLYEQLNKRAKNRPYLLQKGIKLATVNGRPFDIRVMVQKTNSGVWKSTGIFLKIGRRGAVATNYNQGGDIAFLQQTLTKAGFSKAQIQKIEEELKKLGESVGNVFSKHGSGFHELGLDVALDKEGVFWILEVNTRPQIYPLKDMKDKSMYKRIISYAKQYGRKK